MPLIAKKSKVAVEEIRVKMLSELKQEILDYCDTFSTGDLSYFIGEAVQFVLAKDKDWQERKKIKTVT